MANLSSDANKYLVNSQTKLNDLEIESYETYKALRKTVPTLFSKQPNHADGIVRKPSADDRRERLG